MAFKEDVDFGTHGGTDGGDAVEGGFEPAGARGGGGGLGGPGKAAFGVAEGVEFHGGEAGGGDLEGGLGVVFGGAEVVAPAIGVTADRVADFAAEQVVNGDAEGFAFEVVEGDVERAGDVAESEAGLAPGTAEDAGGVGLDGEGVLAQEGGAVFLEVADGRLEAAAVGGGHFAEAVQAGVGVDQHKDRVPAGGGGVAGIDDFNAGDFHGRKRRI